MPNRPPCELRSRFALGEGLRECLVSMLTERRHALFPRQLENRIVFGGLVHLDHQDPGDSARWRVADLVSSSLRGQQRHIHGVRAMSASPPLATKSLHCGKRRLGPGGDMGLTR
jgi:hypothetical protein